MIEPGLMRHRVIVERNDPTRAPSGAMQANWTRVAERWAAIEPQSGREYMAARQVQSEMTHMITLRGPLKITPRMRLRMDDRIFDILSVMDIGETGSEIRLICREGTVT